MEFIVRHCLRDRGKLLQVLRLGVRLLLPGSQQSQALQTLNNQFQKVVPVKHRIVPGKATLCKLQLSLDAAYMVWWARNRAGLASLDYWKADSSPQAGIDILTSQVLSIPGAEIVELSGIVNELVNHARGTIELTPEERRDRAARVRNALVFHRQPCQALGSGRTHLAHKVSAFIWALSMESAHNQKAYSG